MNIYIPRHIREIGVVSKMCELIEKYADSKMYVDNTSSSFNNYYYYLKADPINRFLHFCIPESDWIENEDQHPGQEYESVISYLSRLFYSVKGTYQVLEYMNKYLNLGMTYTYTVKTLDLTISEVTLSDIDEKIYYNALMDFLKALLYFDSAVITIDLVKLQLSNTLRNYTGAHIVTYKEYTTVKYPDPDEDQQQ